MAYVAPYIDSTGLHLPAYNDIRDDLIAQFQSIYGSSVYLGTDSADYQFISVMSLRIYDVMQAIQLAYNSRSPVTSIGAALDSIVKLNGITRKSASYSVCQITVTGIAGTVITNGVVKDPSGNKWSLPSSVTIGAGGFITVTAICQVIGAVSALVGNLSGIDTPTAGWVSVTNASAAVAGQPIESDSQLRARQVLSVSLPSNTLLAGTIAAIAIVATRYNVLQNVTNAEDSNHLIGHSIWAVVEGGTDAQIAEAIFYNKGPGCGTNGTTTAAITDSLSNIIDNIKFSRPTLVPIYVSLTVQLLAGGTSATLVSIHDAVVAYLNSLQIGEMVTRSALFGAALSVMPNLSLPLFSVTIVTLALTATPTVTADLVLAFNEVAQGISGHVIVSEP